jgi:hypothetical protein
MQIFLKLTTGKQISIEVEPTDRIEVIKGIIEEKTGYPPDKQRFVCNGILLDDPTKTLQDYAIQADSTLHQMLDCFRYRRIPFTIFVETSTGERFPLEVILDDIGFEIKKKIQELKGIPRQQQKLTFNTETLIPFNSLEEYHLRADDTLHLTICGSS